MSVFPPLPPQSGLSPSRLHPRPSLLLPGWLLLDFWLKLWLSCRKLSTRQALTKDSLYAIL